ncbi:MAG TPA: response regulator [Xanthobacteraceae bacterium]|nr:response regulator [Xanthobacteraceae bacterium]
MPRILVIDDDTRVLGTIQSWLIREGYEVVAVSDGRNGLLAFEHSPFDAVMVDLFMPDMDGAETIHALHRLNPQVAIIAMSGMTFFRETRERAPDFLGMGIRINAVRTLHKPFKRAELIAAVRACVAATRGGARARDAA